MGKSILAALAMAMLCALPAAGPAEAGLGGYYQVGGVAEDDMLKMRAGPGIGYKVILGLPNGTLLRIHSCEQIGGMRWCKVSLKEARGLKGYVSWTYLREN